jgi:ParB-like chromosome segregation protein Spo0J
MNTTATAGEPALQKMPIEDVILWGNVRKTINPASIDEMAESILQHGIIQPPLARLREGKVELYAGQRRFYGQTRAITLAEERAKDEALAPDVREHFQLRAQDLKIITLLVQDLDDRTIKERQLLENLQREDVSPREEAEGYAELMALVDDSGAPMYTLEKIAERVGKNFRYVSQRLGLRKAPEKMWAAYEEGTIGTRHLELVGRIPTAKKREEAAKAILEPKYRESPLTVEETIELIEEEYRVSLKGCGFDLKDEDLLPVEYKDEERIKGGACITCPHFTGNMKELEGELMGSKGKDKGRGRTGGIAGNLCCNPSCFEEKQKLLWRRTKEAAEREGRRVMDVDQSSKEFDQYSGRLQHNSKYVDLGERPNVHDTGHYSEEQHPEWDELLKGTDAKKQAIMVRHPITKRVHLLLERDKAIEFAEGNGHKKIFAQRPKAQKQDKNGSSGGSAADDAANKAARRERLFNDNFEALFIGAVMEKARVLKMPDATMLERGMEVFIELVCYDTPELLRPMVGVAMDDYGANTEELLMKAMKDELKGNPGAWFAWFMVCTTAFQMERDYEHCGKEVATKVPICKTMVDRLGIDVKSLEKMAKEATDRVIEREAAAKELAELEKKGKVEFTATDLVQYHAKGAMPRRQTMEAVLHKLAKGVGKELGVEQVQWVNAEIKKAFPKAKAKDLDDLSDTQAMELISSLAPQEKKDAKEPAKKDPAPPKKAAAKKVAAKKAPAKKAAKSRA